jgi:hypothetical protein
MCAGIGQVAEDTLALSFTPVAQLRQEKKEKI